MMTRAAVRTRTAAAAGDCAGAAVRTGPAALRAAWLCCCCKGLVRGPAACWRRDTRLDTAVAVPATTAVRAMPNEAHGLVLLPRVYRANRLPRRGQPAPLDVVDRDAAARDDLGAGAPHGAHERRGPRVLVDDERHGVARLDEPGGLLRGRRRRAARRPPPRRRPGRARRHRRDRGDGLEGPVGLAPTNLRSRIRMMPRSTRSTRIAMPSPVQPGLRELQSQVVDRTHVLCVIRFSFQ